MSNAMSRDESYVAPSTSSSSSTTSRLRALTQVNLPPPPSPSAAFSAYFDRPGPSPSHSPISRQSTMTRSSSVSPTEYTLDSSYMSNGRTRMYCGDRRTDGFAARVLSRSRAPSLATLADHYRRANGSSVHSLQPKLTRASSTSTGCNGYYPPHRSTAPPLGSALKVSEAVKSFRLLEALRNGDVKAMRPFLDTAVTSQGSGANGQDHAAPIKELTSPLHLAVRCAEYHTIEYILKQSTLDINAVEAHGGNTPLHIASSIGRTDVVDLLLAHKDIDDTVRNKDGQDPMDVAQTVDIVKLFQISRAQINFTFLNLLEKWEKDQPGSNDEMKAFLNLGRIRVVDLNVKSRVSGTTLLHEAVRRKDTQMIELAVRQGADVFGRNKRNKRVLETTKDEKIKALLQQLSNAGAAMAASQSQAGLPPIFRGYLGKWTNYARGYKNRWFVLENGILSYYHTPEEEGKQSRGSTNLRFAKIKADPTDKLRFEVHSDPPSSGKSGSRLYLRGSHPVERARWVQVLQHTADFFDLDRSNSRAESIRSTTSTQGDNPFAAPSSAMPAGTPGQVPSRATTPFRGIPSPGPLLGRPGAALSPQQTNIMSMTSQMPRSSSPRVSDAKASMDFVKSPIEAKTPSIMTHGSVASDHDMDDMEGSVQDASIRPMGLPFQNELALVANSLRTQLELSQQLVNATQSGDSEAQKATREALQTSSTLFSNYESMIMERETYLTRRYEQEIAAKHLWEENIKTLAQQYAVMEQQLQEAAQENAAKRKALREVRAAGGSAVSSPVPASSQPSGSMLGAAATIVAGGAAGGAAAASANRGPVRPSAQRGALQFDDRGLSSPTKTPSGSAMNVDDSEDPDDEFFDAIESGNLPGLKIGDGAEEVSPAAAAFVGKPAPAASTPQPTAQDEAASEQRVTKLWPGVEPYTRLRDRMPIGKDDRPSMSLWSILKNNIGKDLTKISFPVSFNEPTSMLQRMAEDMTYAYLLDVAVRQQDSTLRIAYVAAFACSNYVTTLGRVSKPFNPMLGETFEFINAKGPCKYRYQSEQVSHHPPISACVAESLAEDGVHARPAWEYSGCVQAQSKFLGRTFEIRPTGMAHVKLVVNGKHEHYSFKKVTSSVSGFVTGSPTIDHFGDMQVKCHTTGDECLMTFKPRGWRSSGMHELKGTVTSGKDGHLAWDIAGRWSSQIVARRAAGQSANLDPDGNTDSLSTDPTASASGSTPEMVLLWKYQPQPPGPFNLTPYAVLLNDMPDGLHDWLPPTDCRLRPDLRLFERGQYDQADVMKRNLEEFQRATRRKREAGELPKHKPKYFALTTEPETQADYWEPHRAPEEDAESASAADTAASGAPVPQYWVRRRQGKWNDVDRIFGEYTV